YAVVGADHGVAVVLQAVAALLALAAAVDDAAHAHQVAGPEAGDPGADLGHPADNLASRHAGEQRAGPFRPHLVQVGVAHAAVGDVDAHVLRAGGTAGDVERHQRLIAGVGAPGFDGHGRTPVGDGQAAMVRERPWRPGRLSARSCPPPA